MAGKSLIGALRVTLGLDSAQFSQGMAKSRTEIKKTESAISKSSKLVKGALGGMFAAVSVGEIAQITKSALDYAAGLGEVASQLGVTTKALQEYRYIAGQSGVSQEQMDKSLQRLTRQLGSAASGNKAAIESFKALNVQIRDSEGNVRATGDVLPDIADAIAKIPDPAQRAAAAYAVWGKQAQTIMPILESGSAVIRQQAAEARSLGIVLSDEQIQNADKTADKIEALQTAFSIKIADVVTKNAGAIDNLINQLFRLVGAADDAVKSWKTFQLRLDQLDIWSEPLGTTSFSDRSRRARAIGAEIDFISGETNRTGGPRARQKFTPSIDPAYLRAPVSGGNAGMRPDDRFLQLTPSLFNQRRNAMGSGLGGGQGLARFGSGAGVGNWMASANDEAVKAATVGYPALAAASKKLSKEQVELRDALQGVLDRLFPEAAEKREFEAELALLATAHKKNQINAQDHAAAVEALRREYLGLARFGMGEAVEVLESQRGELDEAIDRSRNVSDRIEDAFEKIGQSAKLQRGQVVESFAQMTDGVLRETDRLLKGIKSGNVLDIVGGLLGVLDGIGNLTGGFNLGPLKFGSKPPGFATGGSMVLGGRGGTDRNLLSLNGSPLARVSAGETMTITPANDRGGGPVVFDLRGAVMTEDLLRQMNAIGARSAQAGARGGANLALSTLAKRQARALA